ncbi:hypothetical protein CesoFtcFv8_018578 [Champsocephalus esox]|uniref:Uncharacterized protein n=1 Tax=Champsocephalus esox TaxID=159716 RepID=A0AAN8BHP4_9TELE|nr:hypothetical protein CesoFtcFv8_018578 [Champsocephalus esox]
MNRPGLSFLLPVVAEFSLAERQPRPALETAVEKASPSGAPTNRCVHREALLPRDAVTKRYQGGSGD